ncbi:galactose oxidase-like domain-containing protein, partial [Variovorax sp. JS1663]|uniref:galactose oxidase-like domain-containing protein n=1 Tax=Variovorax sp. JS1663 TaxID=1851577 RepID=UPI000B349C71
MPSTAPDPPASGFKWIALWAPLVITACGGGGGDGAGLAAAPAGSAGKPESTPAAQASSEPPAKPTPISKAVRTLEDLARQRELERDRVAPIDRGDGAPGQQPGAATAAAAAAAAAVAPNVGGQWAAPINWPINPIHTVLTPDGKVMSYGTDPAGAQGAQLYYDVWTPATNAHSLLQHTTRTDLFCSAQAVLPASGQVLLAGGDTRGVTPTVINNGVRDVNLYDPAAATISPGPPMQYARWYGSLVPLADGRMLALAGIDGTGAGAGVPEIYRPTLGWLTLSAQPDWPGDWFYPRAVLAPNGRVLVASNNRLFSMNTETPFITQIGTLPKVLNWSMPWAMFDRGKILLIAEDGGAMVVDFNGSVPIVTSVAGPGANRIWSTLTVLPDGKVLLTGGSSVYNELVNTAFSAMIWNPATGLWTTGNDAQKARLYHSSAMLLPDGTVLSGGGGSPGPVVNLNAEIYSPPYLFDSTGARRTRPLINTTPSQLTLGTNFRVTVASSRPIQRVTLVRTGSVTHSTDFGQRFLQLPFTQASGSANVDITLNESPNILPIGYYLLFVIDNAGVPSVGKILKLGGSMTQVANQGQSFTLPASTVVEFGTGGNWIPKTVTGSVSCKSDFFGGNPSPTVTKACRVLATKASGVTPGSAPATTDRTVASQGGSFTTTSATLVSYGADRRWVDKVVNGAGACTAAFFGSDPAPSAAKICVADSGAAPPAPPPPPRH